MNGEYVLAGDIGSSACKTIAMDLEGNVLAASQKEFTSYHPHPGWAEQNPNEWYEAFCETAKQVLSQNAVKSHQLKAAGLVGVTHNFVMLDANEEPLGRSILMFDIRSSQQVDDILKRWGDEVHKRTLNDVTTTWSWPQLLWIKENEPAKWTAAKNILFPKDYVRHKLAPSMVTDHIDASGTLLFEPEGNTWIKSFCDDLELDIDILPKVKDPFEIVSEVSRQGSIDSGIPCGTPVIAGTTDTVAEVLGSGATRVGEATVKLASVGRIAAVAEEPIRQSHVFNYRHVVPNLWYPGTASKSAASAYRWLRGVLFPDDKTDGIYRKMDIEAEQTPLGAGGLLFHPHLMGEWAPYWDDTMRGSFIGLTARHSRAHIIRAALEGVAFSLRDAMSEIESFGISIESIRLIGQGSRSRLWAKIVADVMNRPLSVPKESDAAYGGALMIAASVRGKGAQDLILRSLTKMEYTVEPGTDNVSRYDDLFAIYRTVDEHLVPVSRRLKKFEE